MSDTTAGSNSAEDKPINIDESSSKDYTKEETDKVKQVLLGLNYQKVNLADYQNSSKLSNLISSLFQIRETREAYFATLNQIRNFYFVQLVLDVLTDDVMIEDRFTGMVIDVSVKTTNKNSKKYTEDLVSLFSDFHISDTIQDILGDCLLYGEYSLKTNATHGTGITSIQDNVPAGDVIALYDGVSPKIFFRKDVVNGKSSLVPQNLSEYAHFCMNDRRIKIQDKIFEDNLEVFKSPIFRIGRSVFYSALDKILELMMLEKAATANTFAGLIQSNIVSVNMPSSMDVEDMIKITKKYESLLNNIKSFDFTDLNKIDTLISESLNIKVIPNFSEKGQLDKVNLADLQSKGDLIPQINDMRTTISQTLGIPPELLFGDGSQSRRSALKQYVRYSRKIKSIHYMIQGGLKQICLNHLANKYNDSEIAIDDIVIDLHSDTNVDEIDNLESVELIMSGLNAVINLFDTMSRSPALGGNSDEEGNPAPIVDRDQFFKYIKSTLKSVGFRASDSLLIGSDDKSTTENKSITEIANTIQDNISKIKDSTNKDIQE